MQVVGKAKGDEIILNNGVYYGKRLGMPWFTRPSKIAPFTWPVQYLNKTVYVDPKNVGLIPWEHEWEAVNPVLFQAAKIDDTIDLIKKPFKEKWMAISDQWNNLNLGGGNSNAVFAPSDPIAPKGTGTTVIPRTDPKGSPNQQQATKSRKGLLIGVVVLIVIGIGFYLYKKRK